MANEWRKGRTTNGRFGVVDKKNGSGTEEIAVANEKMGEFNGKWVSAVLVLLGIMGLREKGDPSFTILLFFFFLQS